MRVARAPTRVDSRGETLTLDGASLAVLTKKKKKKKKSHDEGDVRGDGVWSGVGLARALLVRRTGTRGSERILRRDFYRPDQAPPPLVLFALGEPANELAATSV